ncbi:DUF4225 domain-containing protein [Vibrio kanaloae]|uniref:Putative membrane protein n=1 Tax=Vibrio sp. FF_307 TaxID=1652834 RepID=A0A0H3ZWY7_9VIBR|nr:DUF4225 domain-containing protein [Vibrio kanaloae]AKN39067.1 putative membrane protein [Vibrio sp. FF_307]
MGTIIGMRNQTTPDSWDIREVEKAGKGLTMQAVTLSHRYISNGGIKMQFVRDVDRFEQCLVNDFKSGKKNKEAVFKELKKERQNLIDQGALIAQKGIGLVAGVMQVAAGAGICYASAGSLCLIVGTPMAAHGMSNIQENGKYFLDGDENATGFVRKGYQHTAEFLGYSKSHGDIAYYGIDLSLSAYGLAAKTTTVKNASETYQVIPKPNLKPMPWTNTRKAKQFKLFRYSSEDYLRGYQAMSKSALGVEIGADYYNIDSIMDSKN